MKLGEVHAAEADVPVGHFVAEDQRGVGRGLDFGPAPCGVDGVVALGNERFGHHLGGFAVAEVFVEIDAFVEGQFP